MANQAAPTCVKCGEANYHAIDCEHNGLKGIGLCSPVMFRQCVFPAAPTDEVVAKHQFVASATNSWTCEVCGKYPSALAHANVPAPTADHLPDKKGAGMNQAETFEWLRERSNRLSEVEEENMRLHLELAALRVKPIVDAEREGENVGDLMGLRLDSDHLPDDEKVAEIQKWAICSFEGSSLEKIQYLISALSAAREQATPPPTTTEDQVVDQTAGNEAKSSQPATVVVPQDRTSDADLSNFTTQVLRLFATADIHDQLFWNCKGQFFVNVNDVFWWGCADLEEITEANIDVMQQSLKDCEAVRPIGEIYAGWLFAARMRKLRPQGASYPEERELWPLFDACGPERETGFGNPHKPGQYKPHSITQATVSPQADNSTTVPDESSLQPSPDPE